jgi:hypothetical protein
MTGKGASGAVNGGQSKKCGRLITLEQKLDVLKQYGNNEKKLSCPHYSLHQSDALYHPCKCCQN